MDQLPNLLGLPALAVASGVAIICSRFLVKTRSSIEIEPPGPKGIPIFGNEFQIPKDNQHLKFDEWTKTYGDVVKITTMGQPVVILGSIKATEDLFESRGAIYSDRPVAVMAGELVGWDRGLGYARYGQRFKDFRRMMHHTMGPRPAQEFMPEQERQARKLLLKLLESPEKFIDHARQSVGSAILMFAYGYKTMSENDPLVNIAEVAMQGFAKTTEPGAFMVDRFPALEHLPSWFPGAGFLRIANEMRADLERLYNVPFDFVRKEAAAGREIPSFTSKYLLENGDPTQEELEFVKAAAASLYSGGSDTTPSSITAFILAMTLYPEIQAKAKAEIDIVTGGVRLPTFSDRANMPYINAMVKEILRWNPVVPLSLPHRTTQNDTYRGYTIGKGTIIWSNIWSCLHDEETFPNPEEFMPERFLTGSWDRRVDPSILAFGVGRRICPGMHVADNSIFIYVASILAIFDITKDRDELGNEITPRKEFEGFIRYEYTKDYNVELEA